MTTHLESKLWCPSRLHVVCMSEAQTRQWLAGDMVGYQLPSALENRITPELLITFQIPAALNGRTYVIPEYPMSWRG